MAHKVKKIIKNEFNPQYIHNYIFLSSKALTYLNLLKNNGVKHFTLQKYKL